MANDIDPALTGAAFDLANAGYMPMPDPKRKQAVEAIGSDRTALREAAGKRSVSQAEVVTRKYTDAEGRPADSNEAVTLARAARDYADATAADSQAAENGSSKEFAAHGDAPGGGDLRNDPDAAEFYDIELPGPGAEEPGGTNASETESEAGQNGSSESTGDRSAAELDPLLEKALQHPQVLQAIEEKIAEAESARQSYREALEAATQIARASFLSQFPEFSGMTPENIPGALELMSRQDPARLARIQATIARTEQLVARQQHEGRRQAEMAQQNFLKYAEAEDARLETMLKGEPKATQQAVLAEIIASAKASGIEPAELNRLFISEPLMRHASFQRMMYDAGKYRLMMKAKDAALSRKVPPVQRPGMATMRSERERADLRTLSARLSSSGDIKDAVALYKARTTKR